MENTIRNFRHCSPSPSIHTLRRNKIKAAEAGVSRIWPLIFLVSQSTRTLNKCTQQESWLANSNRVIMHKQLSLIERKSLWTKFLKFSLDNKLKNSSNWKRCFMTLSRSSKSCVSLGYNSTIVVVMPGPLGDNPEKLKLLQNHLDQIIKLNSNIFNKNSNSRDTNSRNLKEQSNKNNWISIWSITEP